MILLPISIGFAWSIPFWLGLINVQLALKLTGHTVIPSISLITLSILIFKQLKSLQATEVFVGEAGDELRDSIFKGKISMIISGILVFSQTVDWINITIRVSI